jgi:hypothetical protein
MTNALSSLSTLRSSPSGQLDALRDLIPVALKSSDSMIVPQLWYTNVSHRRIEEYMVDFHGTNGQSLLAN